MCIYIYIYIYVDICMYVCYFRTEMIDFPTGIDFSKTIWNAMVLHP